MRKAVWAVVPLKSPEAAKSRLAPVLDADARRRLVLAMARHVVRTLLGTPDIAGVAVATASAEMAALASREGARVLTQARDEGTAEACRDAVARLAGTAERILMVPGDIPLISCPAVAALTGMSGPVRMVAIVPDRRGSGTNALLWAPPAVIAPCFGTGSFQRHGAAARQQGIEPHIVESAELALDIDEPEDLHELRRRLDRHPMRLPADMRQALSVRSFAPAQ